MHPSRGRPMGMLARRRALLALGLAFGVLLVVFVFLPASSAPSATAPTSDAAVPGLEAARAPPALQATLDDLRANFTRVWSAHSAEAPAPIYGGPALTLAQVDRYNHLKRPPPTRAMKIKAGADGHALKPKFMLTTLTRNIGDQLPDLLNAIAVLVAFLGPEHVSFSFVEGPSGDPTPYVLDEVLVPLLHHLGVPPSQIRVETNAPHIDFNNVNRIEKLAELRNKALEPLWADNDLGYLARTPERRRRMVGADVAAVVFFNDVFLHAADILEVLHQHVSAKGSTIGAGITTAWDWMERNPAYFYDVWVARAIDTGDLFYPIDQPSWSPSTDILPTSEYSRARYEALQPFQVYSAWNGLAVLSPTPFLPPFNVRFRRGNPAKGECAASECTLIAADFWKYNWGRVQVVPSVQVAYGRKAAVETALELRKSEERLGWRDGVPPRNRDAMVAWEFGAPPEVRCHPWPEKNGLDANVWEKTEWVKPYIL
ncbi:hypothetical protein Q8F55_005905 [Vanrija albida]|uniref:Alpha-1,3-mannosyltransferase CMT1 n=1 Tax=Vanrija albida TaxID=181172 RepID=A0ABR3Q3P3_9TREE